MNFTTRPKEMFNVISFIGAEFTVSVFNSVLYQEPNSAVTVYTTWAGIQSALSKAIVFQPQ